MIIVENLTKLMYADEIGAKVARIREIMREVMIIIEF